MKKTNEDAIVMLDVIIVIIIFGLFTPKFISILDLNRKIYIEVFEKNNINYFNEELLNSLYLLEEKNNEDIFFRNKNLKELFILFTEYDSCQEKILFEDFIVKILKNNRGEFLWEIHYEILDYESGKTLKKESILLSIKH